MILHKKLKMLRITACWVPRFLTEEQRDQHFKICHKWLKITEDESDVMACVITGDVSWIHHFDPAIKQESIHWKSPQLPVKEKSLSDEFDE